MDLGIDAVTSMLRYRQRLQGSIYGWCMVLGLMVAISGCVARPALPPGTKITRDLPAGERLVAAGVLKGDMATRAKVVNDLRIVKVASGQMTILFDGYRLPEAKSGAYKVTVEVSRVGTMVVPSVSVDAFAPDGIVLRVNDPDGKMPLPLKYLVEHEFRIEVLELHSQ